MFYYTIYLKHLQNGTGYIDLALESDELLKDYLQFLDIGMKTHKRYPVCNPPSIRGQTGVFAINLADIAAIALTPG